MKQSFSALSWCSMLLLTACVTINIYFPAAAAEQVADEIIHDIQDENTIEPSSQIIPDIIHEDRMVSVYQGLDQILDVLFSTAYASEADLNVDTAQIRKLRAAMKARFNALLPFYNQGLIGIQHDGLLTVRDSGRIPLKDRNTVNKLLSAENADRNSLYQAIANANGHSEWAGQIKSTFAMSWINNARSGWWYQLANGSWKQK